MEATRNVVLFGECGVGKSSIVNAIVGQPVAETSNDVLGCTEKNASYTVTLDSGIKVNIWDTVGLDEGTVGKIPASRAKQDLKLFLQRQIAAPEGVDLLLYCIRGANGEKSLQVKWGHREKYMFVFEEVCKKRVPMALIVTGLESYDPSGDMDTWWDHGKGKILEFGFQLCAHACVAVLPPELWSSNENVDRIAISRRRLHDLLSRHFLAPRNVLLFGDREDKDDFIDVTIASCNKQVSNRRLEGVSPFTCTPIAFDAHTHINLWNLTMTRFDETDIDALVTERNLKLLVQGIKRTPGIDQLVFCFRAGSLKIRHVRNYNLYYAAICRKKVPVAIVVLGPEKDTDSWWRRNEQGIRERGFCFDRHLYIPCDPCQLSGSGLGNTARGQLIHVLQEEYTSGSWGIGDDPFWVTVPNVRAVLGGLSWPTTTAIVCDATRHGAFVNMASNIQSSLQRVSSSQRVHRFQQVDPQSLSPIAIQPSGTIEATHVPDRDRKGIGLILFFVSAERSDSEMWETLERLYTVYKGGITPLIVVICGDSEHSLAGDFWNVAPRRIKRRIGAYLTYHPGPDAPPEAQAAAQEVIVDMIRDRCLVDLGERVGILQEILSIWRKYRSQRNRVADGAQM